MRKLLRKLKNWYYGKPEFLVNPQAPIVEAFTSGGTMYYMFEDIFSMPCQRALEANTFYEEMKSRLSKEYLTDYLEAMTAVLSDPKGINVSKIVLLTNTLKERTEFIIDSDIVFKLASVMYFDKNENPYQYDMKYNHKKMLDWKQNEDVADFFLRTPIKDFLPFTDISKEDLDNYLKIAEKVKSHHQKIVSEAKSSPVKN